MAEISSSELRIRWLEMGLQALARRVTSLLLKQGDGSGASSPFGGQPTFYRAQATTSISAASGNALGFGTARILQVIGTSRYKLVPDFTVTVYNDTGSSIGINTYLIVAQVDGLFTVFVGDCATASPTAAPDPP